MRSKQRTEELWLLAVAAEESKSQPVYPDMGFAYLFMELTLGSIAGAV